MGIQVLPDDRGNSLTRFGRGFGEGLSQQLPKEVDRYRLASGLKNLQQNPQANPIEQLSQLYQSGATPEQINQIVPYLKNAAITAKNKNNRRSPIENGNQGMNPQNGMPQPNSKMPNFMSGIQGQQNSSEAKVQPNQNLIPAQGEQAGIQTILPPTPEQYDARTRELMQEEPELYQGENAYASAYARAKDELDYPMKAQSAMVAANAAQEELATKATVKLREKTEKKLQKSGNAELYSMIPGEAYNRAENRVKLAVQQGKSTDQATEQESNMLSEMGKKINTLRNNIASRPFFGKATDQTRKDVQKLKPFFEKNGELELFKDEQKGALDIGDHLASYETWRPNKTQEKVISSLSAEDSPQKMAAKLYDTIDDNTSLFSLGYLINKIGGDDQAVINELSNIDSGFSKKKLNDRQNRESTEYYTLTPQFGDLFYTATFGPLYIPAKALFNYVTGTKEKLGPVENIKRYFGKE